MIEGLKLDVRTEELKTRIGARIAEHQAKVDGYARQLQRLVDIGPDPEDDSVLSEFRGGGSPRSAVERKHQQHSERVALLTFLRDHLVEGEIYRLSQEDLRFAEFLPDRFGW